MRPAGQARRRSKLGICDRGATQPDGMQRRLNVEVFLNHRTRCLSVVALPWRDTPGSNAYGFP